MYVKNTKSYSVKVEKLVYVTYRTSTLANKDEASGLEIQNRSSGERRWRAGITAGSDQSGASLTVYSLLLSKIEWPLSFQSVTSNIMTIWNWIRAVVSTREVYYLVAYLLRALVATESPGKKMLLESYQTPRLIWGRNPKLSCILTKSGTSCMSVASFIWTFGTGSNC